MEARKISLVKEFLNIDNEKTIRAVEELLRNERIKNYKNGLRPMTMKQYKAEIEMAIHDKESGRLVKAGDLKKQIREWS